MRCEVFQKEPQSLPVSQRAANRDHAANEEEVTGFVKRRLITRASHFCVLTFLCGNVILILVTFTPE